MNAKRAGGGGEVLRWLASLKLTVVLLLLLAALVAGGTVYQATAGIYAARSDVFGAWVIPVLGFIPLPGMLPVALLLLANLLAALAFRLPFRWRGAGLLLIHAGLLLLIGGGFFIAVTAQEFSLTLREGESGRLATAAGGGRVTLPVTLRLIDFARKMHPGTDVPRSFTSRVEVLAAGSRRRAVIAMNRPLRWRDYTFYQSAYSEDGSGGESSTFSVVRNSGRWIPYGASAMIFLGLTGHFLGMLIAALRKRPATASEPDP
ncbi:MAG: cytochrome c biogenesis protein ResB [Candidatus Aminicenantes bacterium]|nr:cytochrome c biogenesis protein ResB [Candidatus Aminicenantes bacterium]